MSDRQFTFIGGHQGAWAITGVKPIVGVALPLASHLDIVTGHTAAAPESAWALRGVTSSERYVTRAEKESLAAVQEPLGRPGSTRGALIPIRKSPAWWALAQDERRAILEERSRHITIGLAYLPPVARKLYHARDLGEPFDFLTWFEFAPEYAGAFDDLLAKLRATEEWQYVEREVEVRMERSR